MTTKHIRVYRVGLYRKAPSPGQTIPVGVKPCPIEDYVTENEEIYQAVKRLQLNRSRGPSGMRAEHLHKLIEEAKREEALDATNWRK